MVFQMPLSINAATSGSIHAIMENLVVSPPACLHFPVKGVSKRCWMVDTDAHPIVQLECLDSLGQAIVFATTARDGSRPLRAASTTMLLLEDTIANSMHPHSVCSGEATITIHRFVDLTDATEDSNASGLAEFAHAAAVALSERGIGLSGAPLEDECEIA